MPIAITITVTTDSVNVFGLQLALPDLAGGNWSAAPVNGECDTDFYCFPFGMGGAPGFELHLTSPTTEASCGTHTISAEAFGTQGSAINSGSVLPARRKLSVADWYRPPWQSGHVV